MSAWVNGQPMDQISVHDRALQFGDGVFRTMLVQRGSVIFAAAQLERLLADAGRLSIAVPDIVALTGWITAAAATIDAGILKVILSRGQSERGYVATAGLRPNCIIYGNVLPAHVSGWRKDGIRVRQCSIRLAEQPALAGIKHLNRLENVLARLEWQDSGTAEGLLLDSQGYVVEGVMSNLFWAKDGQLFTPDLQRCGVAGVMRQLLMEQQAVQQVRVRMDVLLAADEVFMCNSVMGIVPVRQLDETTWQTGEITRRLQENWRDAFPD